MANEKHLKILKRGVVAWNQWRQKNNEVVPDLVNPAKVILKVLTPAEKANKPRLCLKSPFHILIAFTDYDLQAQFVRLF
jgi:hypothetical protein